MESNGAMPHMLRLLRTDEIDPRRRGHEAGVALSDEIHTVERAYERLFAVLAGLDRAALLRFGEKVLERVSEWRPALVAEIEGIAAGAGLDAAMVATLNARTELTPMPECSTVARLDAPDGPWLAQNWDWYLDAPERCVLWSAAVDAGRFLTMTEAGLLAKIGINSHGLAVSLNILHHSRSGGPVGVPIHLMLRELLATCATVEEADAVLADAPASASSAITVVDAQGDGASFEVSPVGVRRIEPTAGRLVHTNHFLAADIAAAEPAHAWLAGSRSRYARLVEARPEMLDDAVECLCDHSCRPQAVCRHDEPSEEGMPMVGTVVSLAMRPAERRMAVAAGPPCVSAFIDYALTGDVALA